MNYVTWNLFYQSISTFLDSRIFLNNFFFLLLDVRFSRRFLTYIFTLLILYSKLFFYEFCLCRRWIPGWLQVSSEFWKDLYENQKLQQQLINFWGITIAFASARRPATAYYYFFFLNQSLFQIRMLYYTKHLQERRGSTAETAN